MKKNFLIGLLTIFSLNVQSQIPTNGLVAYYPFNGNANDSSGNNLNGTVNGATLTTDRFGNINCAYVFNGTSDYIEIANNALLNLEDSLTISCWINSTDVTASQRILDKSTSGTSDSWCFDLPNNPVNLNELRLICGGATPNLPYSTHAITQNNTWYFVAATYDRQNVKFYINGVLDSIFSLTTQTPINGNPVRIGAIASSLTNGNFFSGKIDDIGIWNRALTASEIQQIYSGCSAVPVTSISSYGNTTFCAGSDVLLVASPATGVTYQWQKNSSNISGATSKTYMANSTGNFRCVVSNLCGPSNSNSIHTTKLSVAGVSISAGGPLAFCAGNSVILTGTNPGNGYNYQWFRNSISINGATALSYIAYNPGSYKIMITNTANGCIRNSGTKTVVVNCRSGVFQSLGGFSNDNGINVFPNPIISSFSVDLNMDLTGRATIELLNMLGQQIFKSFSDIENGQSIDESHINGNIKSGLYLIRVTVNEQAFISKVMIK